MFCLEQLPGRAPSLYLLGSDHPYASLAPLFTAITGHVFEGAKAVAGRSRNGRLDPPLTLALDEAALICPVPLPSMTADSGGRGIQLLMRLCSRRASFMSDGVSEVARPSGTTRTPSWSLAVSAMLVISMTCRGLRRA